MELTRVQLPRIRAHCPLGMQLKCIHRRLHAARCTLFLTTAGSAAARATGNSKGSYINANLQVLRDNREVRLHIQ